MKLLIDHDGLLVAINGYTVILFIVFFGIQKLAHAVGIIPVTVREGTFVRGLLVVLNAQLKIQAGVLVVFHGLVFLADTAGDFPTQGLILSLFIEC